GSPDIPILNFSMPYLGMNPGEFPHSEICGSTLICSSPQLIAAYHVFLRLPVPRHSPCALLRLTINASLEFLPPTALSLFYSNCQQDCYSLPVETVVSRSEERRVGKECRWWWAAKPCDAMMNTVRAWATAP